MSVLTGPREEWRRIMFEGTPVWVKPEGDRLRLGDGRTVAEADAIYMPPCDPSKIICIHLNYESRRVEFHAPPLTTPSTRCSRTSSTAAAGSVSASPHRRTRP